MKVLVATNMYPSDTHRYSGVFVAREVEGLRERGVDVRVVHADTPADKRRYVTARREVADALASFEPDLVHVHFGLSQAFVPSTTVPRVVTFHGTDLTDPRKRLVSLRLARGAAALIVVSPELASYAAGLGAPVSVVPAGVDVSSLPDLLDRQSARAKLGLPEDALVALFPASRHRAVKRYDLFERAIVSRGERRAPDRPTRSR